MNKDLTELVFILDRSGSMEGLESDTIGGFNSMLSKQQKIAGDAIVTTVLFDDRYEILHDRVSIGSIKPIDENNYFVRGTTALLDAIGITISRISAAIKKSENDERAEKVLFVIITDGMENASREYDISKIKSMIEKKKEKYSWEFIFLGANIDAISEAEKIGISAERAVRFHSDQRGTVLNYSSMSRAVEHFRKEKNVSDNWKSEIERDFYERKSKRV